MSTTQDLAGRTMIVTGANTGLGRVTAEALCGRGARVYLAGRSEERTRPVLEGIRAKGGDAKFLALDLADLGKAGPGVHSYSLHPGGVATDVWREVPWGIRHVMKLFLLTDEQGARTQLWCATSPDVAAQDGLYYDGCKVKKPSALADDAALARTLWEKSEAWVAGS